VKCPNCGAENSNGTMYRGSCAAQLKEPGPTVRNPQSLPDQPDLPPQVAGVFDGLYPKDAVIAIIIILALSSMAFFMGIWHLLGLIIATITIMTLSIALLMRRMTKRSGPAESIGRHLSSVTPLRQSGAGVSARSMALGSVVMMTTFALVGGAVIAFSLYVAAASTNIAAVAGLVIGGTMLGMILMRAGTAVNHISLSKDGIRVHNPSAGFVMSFSRSDLSVVEMKGRTLRMAVKKAPSGMFRQSRHVILGNARMRDEFAQAVQSFGLGMNA